MSEPISALLDDPERLSAGDPGDMMGRTLGAADLWRAAAAESASFTPPASWRDLEGVVVAGMGGSAIAADLAAAWLERRWSIPVAIVRDYRLPAWVDRKRLFIACSYSGNTEETLSAWADAAERGMPSVGITTGGRLAEVAERAGVPVLQLPAGHPPRAALGASLPTLLDVLAGVGPTGEGSPGSVWGIGEREEVISALEAASRLYGPDIPADSNPAKDLAVWLDRSLPVIYAPAWPLGPVAMRWRGQFAENAKRLAAGHTLPEMNHNEIVGWEAQPDLYRSARVILLEDREQGDRIVLRGRITAEAATEAGSQARTFTAHGDGLLARMLGLVALGDFASIYLALGWGIDPTPVGRIDRLKKRLAEASS